jgi:hypothetical protein
LAVWWRRLAWELVAIAPEPVDVPPLPRGTSLTTESVHLGFELLLALRRFDHPPEPVAFSVRFCAAWCMVTKTAAAKGIRELIQYGVIRETDRKGKVRLYEPDPNGGGSR